MHEEEKMAGNLATGPQVGLLIISESTNKYHPTENQQSTCLKHNTHARRSKTQ